MRDEPLRVTRTNSAEETAGHVLGISTPHFIWIIASLVLGLLLFVGLVKRFGIDPGPAALLAAIPTGVAATFLILRQNRPPGYVGDLLDTWLTGGDASPLKHSASHDHAPKNSARRLL